MSTAASTTYVSGAQMLRSIKGTGLTAWRLREILGQLLVEFPIKSRAEEIFVRQAASLAVISEHLQARYANGDLVDLRIIGAISKGLRTTLTNLRKRASHRGPPPPSIHERLAGFHEMLDAEDDA
jgi:hypothetical protein